ncbi:hypothetical protein BX600DRAFT_428975 [Xylariales sp. PMI_506]|nr:hypothetical protein BX600DRAFT_428975 [Xylariales sp. PMI_506]
MGSQSRPNHVGKLDPRNKATAFVQFLGRLLPSNHPEQGGTFYDQDRSGDSAYIDLGINPEELVQWNIAQDLSPGRRAQLETQPQPETGGSNNSQSRGQGLTRNTKLPVSEQAPQLPNSVPHAPHGTDILSPSGIHALLQSKERNRQNRRELKANGDYLPVTGYDPWSGEWNVLTPTDSISSDTTSPSMEQTLAKLGQDVKSAKLVYEQARNRELAHREKVKLAKVQTKLDRIERAKNDIKRQHRNIKWKRHGEHWSSVAEPNLSPIAQSQAGTPSSTRKSAFELEAASY